MEKTIIENFEKKENEIKVALLKEIKETFEGYKTEEVLFYTIFDNTKRDGFDELETMMYDVCPQIVNDDIQIDATALPYSICYEDDELILKVDGECSDPDRAYITLEEPSFGLTVNGLYIILLILQHPKFKGVFEKNMEDEDE
jgi:hypothetical protein